MLENSEITTKDVIKKERETTDRASIQRLIREVEKLVREEDRSMATSKEVEEISRPNSTSLQSHRAKYARIKEWLALNSTRCNEGKCTAQVRKNHKSTRMIFRTYGN